MSGKPTESNSALSVVFYRSDQHTQAILSAIDLVTLLLRQAPSARSIGEIFAHIIEVRIKQLELHSGQEFISELEPLSSTDTESRDALAAALEESANCVINYLEAELADANSVLEGQQKVSVLLAHLIAHDAHHRGQILAILGQNGVEIPEVVTHGIWEWGV